MGGLLGDAVPQYGLPAILLEGLAFFVSGWCALGVGWGGVSMWGDVEGGAIQLVQDRKSVV